MTKGPYDGHYAGTPAENYQRFFVPSIGRPAAENLIELTRLQPGEHVLDVACGTGVVAQLAAERVGADGLVAGLDVNPGMLAVARSAVPSGVSIDWYESSAKSMPFRDAAFDVVLCQMGLQFFHDKLAGLREMRRVLCTGGRVCVTVPGPRPPMFGIMSDALARHLSPDAASFVDLVFSMHDVDQIIELMRGAGFREVVARAEPTELRLPAPRDFLWQYIYSTPLAQAVTQADTARLEALEHDICTQWQKFAAGGSLSCHVGMTTGSALK